MASPDEPTDKRLEAFIKNPVRSSLRASIREEETRFRLPNEFNNRFLFNLCTLDAWEDGSDSKTVVESEEYLPSPHLPDEVFRSNTSRRRLKVRLLIVWPRFSVWNPKNDAAKQTLYLPFMPDDIYDLIEAYHLPYDWLHLRYLSPEVGNYIRRTEWTRSKRPQRIGIVIHFPFVLMPARRYDFLTDLKDETPDHTEWPAYHPFRDDLYLWSIAMSYSFESAQTRGILDGVPPRAQMDIRARMAAESSAWLDHPLHLPKVLSDIFMDHAAWEINRLGKETDDLEDFSKNAKNKALDDTDSITTQLSIMGRSLEFLENLTTFLLETLDFFDETLHDDEEQSRQQQFIQNGYHQMKEDLNNMLSLIKNNQETCVYLKSRSTDAQTYIETLYADESATVQARDARSNTTMSVLQMVSRPRIVFHSFSPTFSQVFLPATAVAAICSMGAFNWQAPSPDNMVGVSKYIWIYWVVALAATLATVSVWVTWVRLQGRGERPDVIKKRDQDEDDIYKERVAREREWVEGGMVPGSGRTVIGKQKDGIIDIAGLEEQFWGDNEKPRNRRKRSKSQRRREE